MTVHDDEEVNNVVGAGAEDGEGGEARCGGGAAGGRGGGAQGQPQHLHPQGGRQRKTITNVGNVGCESVI